MLATAALAGVALVVIYGLGIAGPVVRSDGAGYFAYLPATLIHGDPSMRTLVERVYPTELPEWLKLDARSGAYLDKYPVGTALLMSPFFLVAHGLAKILGLRADGYSGIYQAAAALSGVAYGLAGLRILWRLLEQRFERPAGPVVVALLFGTNLFHHATYDASFSHVYSFFLITTFVWTTVRFHAEPRWSTAAILGVLLGAIALCRPPNGIVVLFLLLYGPARGVAFGLRLRLELVFRQLGKLAVVGAIALAVFAIQLGYWKLVTGHWLVFSYVGERFDFASPKPLHVLVSFKKGLFVWSPLVVLCLVGLWKLRRSDLFVGTVAVLVVQLYVVSSWWCWWFGGGFGHRAFTEYSVFFALGLGALLERAARTPRAIRMGVVGCVVYELVLMALYWGRVIPYGGPNWGPLVP